MYPNTNNIYSLFITQTILIIINISFHIISVENTEANNAPLSALLVVSDDGNNSQQYPVINIEPITRERHSHDEKMVGNGFLGIFFLLFFNP